MKKQNKARNPLVRLVLDFASTYKIAFICALFCICLTVIGNTMAPMTLREITTILDDAILRQSAADNIASQIITKVLMLVAAYIISISGVVGYTQILAVIGQKYMNKLRKRIFEHMEDLPIKYFDTHDKGDIMSIYINDVDTVRQLLIDSVPTIVMCSIIFITVFVMMLTFSIYLALIVIAGLSAMLFAFKHIGKNSAKYFVEGQKAIGVQEGYIEEMMNGLKVVKSFCHEEESKLSFDKINKNLRHVQTNANAYANIMGPVNGNIGNFIYVTVALVGTLLAIYNVQNVSIVGVSALNIGVIVAFMPMVRQITVNFNNIAQQINSISMAYGGSKRICDILDEIQEVDDGYVTLVKGYLNSEGAFVESSEKECNVWAWKNPHKEGGDITYTILKGDIRMYDVDFSYDGENIVLHNVNLYAEPGQKIAFVGATGAGKTTITNLLNRFYDIADGKIRYDGININKISKKSLRMSLGMVLQDTNLFTGTIMENIRYGRLNATDEECIAAAKLAKADSFISRLPQGYNTMLTNDGTNLSQGQRQLLSIARAAVHGAPVMILDEATSNIDTRTESLITKGMDNLMKGRTVFVIAHRLSTIQNSDVIMVLDHGHIIERGSHDELINEKGTYYQLYTGAFELD